MLGAMRLATRMRSAVAKSAALPTRSTSPLRLLSSTATSIEQQYATPLRWMHWIYAGGMLTVVGTVKASPNPHGPTFMGTKGETKGTLMLIHKSTAVLLTALIVPRILLRVATKVPENLPSIVAPAALEHAGHKAVMAAWYGFMLFMPATGIAMGYYGGKGIPFYGVYTIPGKSDKTKEDGAFAGRMFKLHKEWGGYMANYMLPLHVGAAFAHFARGHTIFARVNPFVTLPPK
jgi:cytochrome b561